MQPKDEHFVAQTGPETPINHMLKSRARGICYESLVMAFIAQCSDPCIGPLAY